MHNICPSFSSLLSIHLYLYVVLCANKYNSCINRSVCGDDICESCSTVYQYVISYNVLTVDGLTEHLYTVKLVLIEPPLEQVVCLVYTGARFIKVYFTKISYVYLKFCFYRISFYSGLDLNRCHCICFE